MVLGLVIFLVGVGVTLVSRDMASGGGSYVVAWGAMVGGAWVAFKGARRAFGERPGEPGGEPDPERANALLRIDAMTRCMAFIAAADGKVEDSERAMFADIVERLTGMQLSGEVQRAMFDKAAGQFFDPISLVQERDHILDADFRRLILKAGCFIAMADGSLAEAEASRLRTLGLALKIPREEYDAIVTALQAHGAGTAAAAAGSA